MRRNHPITIKIKIRFYFLKFWPHRYSFIYRHSQNGIVAGHCHGLGLWSCSCCGIYVLIVCCVSWWVSVFVFSLLCLHLYLCLVFIFFFFMSLTIAVFNDEKGNWHSNIEITFEISGQFFPSSLFLSYVVLYCLVLRCVVFRLVRRRVLFMSCLVLSWHVSRVGPLCYGHSPSCQWTWDLRASEPHRYPSNQGTYLSTWLVSLLCFCSS